MQARRGTCGDQVKINDAQDQPPTMEAVKRPVTAGACRRRAQTQRPRTNLFLLWTCARKELKAEVARLRIENEFLKSGGLLRAGAAVAVRYAVIDAEKPT
jgi:hypothetical protein